MTRTEEAAPGSRANEDAILDACRSGAYDVALERVQKDAIDVEYSNGALLRAVCAVGSPAMAEALIKRGAQVTEFVLLNAAASGNLLLLKMLESHCPTFEQHLGAMLYCADAKDCLCMLIYLLDRGAPLDAAPMRILSSLAEEGNLEAVKGLIERGVSARANFDEPIVAAARGGHKDVVNYLLGSGASIDAQDGAPLTAASSRGNLAMVRHLVGKGAAVRANFDMALIAAVEGRHRDVVDYLLDNGASIKAREGLPLAKAASTGSLEMVRHLIKRGAKARASHDAALVAASESGHIQIVKFLSIVEKAKFTAQFCQPLLRAAANGHKTVVLYLLAEDPRVSPEILTMAMKAALLNGHEQLASRFASLGAKECTTKFSHASDLALADPYDVLKALEKKRIDTRLLSEALNYAITHKRAEIVDIILKSDQIEGPSMDGAIMASIQSNDVDTARRLLDEQESAPSPERCSAFLRLAASAGSLELCVTISKACKLSPEDQARWAVCAVARSGSVEQMQDLMAGGTEIAPHAQEALMYAVMSGNVYMVKLLLGRGAALNPAEGAYIASASGSAAMLRFLMDTIPGAGALDYSTALCKAAGEDKRDIVRLLVSTTSISSQAINAAIQAAAGKGYCEMIRILISLGGDVLADEKEALWQVIANDQKAALHFLCAYDDGAYFERLMAGFPAKVTSDYRVCAV